MFAPARSNTTHPSGLPYERSYDRPVPPPAAGLAPPAGEWGNSSSRSAPPRAAVRHTQVTSISEVTEYHLCNYSFIQ
jgi:hypothetical protein